MTTEELIKGSVLLELPMRFKVTVSKPDKDNIHTIEAFSPKNTLGTQVKVAADVLQDYDNVACIGRMLKHSFENATWQSL